MKNIAVACDFSRAALNGLGYAAELASALKESLTLFHVMNSLEPAAEKVEQKRHSLQLLAKEIGQKYHIYCAAQLKLSLQSMEQALAAAAAEHELLVMGTNGAENYYQHFMGSHTLNVMRVIQTPVLMVPERSTYKTIRKIVYAFHPGTNPLFLLDQLRSLALALRAEVMVLHVSEPSNAPASKNMALAVRARSSDKFPLQFDHRTLRAGKTVADEILEYMTRGQFGWLAVSQHHRSLWDQLLKEDVLENLSRLADFPVLLFQR